MSYANESKVSLHLDYIIVRTVLQLYSDRSVCLFTSHDCTESSPAMTGVLHVGTLAPYQPRIYIYIYIYICVCFLLSLCLLVVMMMVCDCSCRCFSHRQCGQSQLFLTVSSDARHNGVCLLSYIYHWNGHR